MTNLRQFPTRRCLAEYLPKGLKGREGPRQGFEPCLAACRLPLLLFMLLLRWLLLLFFLLCCDTLIRFRIRLARSAGA